AWATSTRVPSSSSRAASSRCARSPPTSSRCTMCPTRSSRRRAVSASRWSFSPPLTELPSLLTPSDRGGRRARRDRPYPLLMPQASADAVAPADARGPMRALDLLAALLVCGAAVLLFAVPARPLGYVPLGAGVGPAALSSRILARDLGIIARGP